MAKLQIFVLVAALSQVYGSIEISNFPALLPAEDFEVVDPQPSIVTPPCVESVRALLEAILARLPEIEQPRPLPIDPVEPEVPEVEVPEPESEDAPVVETPCTACFEHINSLLTSAEKVLAIRKMGLALYRR